MSNIPECSSPCLVEPSSIAQRDHTTTAVGSAPYASTQLVLPTPSTSNNATTSTATSTSVSTTTPRASVGTNSPSNLNTTVCNSLLLIKPLTVSGRPAPVNDKTKSLSSLVAKAVDDNNNSLEGTKDIVSSSSTPQESQNITTIDLELSSASASKSSSSASTTNTTDSSNIDHNGKEENADLNFDHQAQIFLQNFVRTTPVEALNDCEAHISPQSELGPVVDAPCDSSNEILGSEITLDPSRNRITSPVPSELGYGIHSAGGHASTCPHYTGGVATGPRGTAVPHQMSSPLVMIPSWTPHNKPVTSSPFYDLPSKSITCKTNHNISSQVSPLPSAAVVQPQTVSHNVTAAVSPLSVSKISNQTLALVTSTKVIAATTSALDGTSSTNSTTCITTTSATVVNATSTVAANTHSICSPVNPRYSHQYRPGSLVPSYPGSGVNSSLYGYGHQNMWMVVPTYPYWRTGSPYYQWPTPLHTQCPVPPSPPYYAAASINATAPTYSGTVSTSSMPSEPGSSGFPLVNNFPLREQKPNEETGSGFVHSKLCEKRNSYSNMGETSGADGKVTLKMPPLTSSPRVKCGEQSAQRKSKGPRTSKPSRQNYRSSPHKAPPSAPRNPGFLSARSASQPALSRSFNPITEVDDLRSPEEFDDSCGLMPITPPPTPILKSDRN